ncbi:hypothetical protein F5X96DRAFT_689872 [Biscogniauxia mediterranea]|nr:hypothetical protein F5X96DRAFT_689872 [Biscogniauxia mediterranea]
MAHIFQPRDHALRVVSAGTIDYGRNRVPSANMRQTVIPRIAGTVAGLEAVQVSRDNPVDPQTLAGAVFFEHRTLEFPGMVSTPFFSHLDILAEDPVERAAALQPLARVFPGNRRVVHHPIFQGISGREFSIFNLQIDGGWIVVVIRIEAIIGPEYYWNPDEGQTFFAYDLVDIAILDPRGGPDAAARRLRVFQVMGDFLVHGSIRMEPGFNLHLPSMQRCADDPAPTGYWAYGITREFITRLRHLAYQRERVGQPIVGQENMPNLPDGFWDNIQEPWNIDLLRQWMVGANALRAVQMTNYQAYVALVVPSDDARERLQSLQPPQDYDVMLPDEYFQGFDNEGPPFVITVPPRMNLPPWPPSPAGSNGGNGGNNGNDTDTSSSSSSSSSSGSSSNGGGGVPSGPPPPPPNVAGPGPWGFPFPIVPAPPADVREAGGSGPPPVDFPRFNGVPVPGDFPRAGGIPPPEGNAAVIDINVLRISDDERPTSSRKRLLGALLEAESDVATEPSSKRRRSSRSSRGSRR